MSEYPSAECKSVNIHPCDSRVGKACCHVWYQILFHFSYSIVYLWHCHLTHFRVVNLLWFQLIPWSSIVLLFYLLSMFIILTQLPLCFWMQSIFLEWRSGSGLGSEVENSYFFYVNVNKACKIVVFELLDPLCRSKPDFFLAWRVYTPLGV
jgi:hypothetical protein